MSGNPLLNALSAIRTPPVMGMSVGYDTLANALSGVPANLAGAPVDMAYMMTMRPEEMAGIAMGMPNQRPELREFPGSSDWIGEKMGADVDSLPFLLSAFISPDGSDVALPAAKLAASGKLDDIITAMAGALGRGGLKRNGDEIARALPMDEASRMARAQEMGFDTDAYHGTASDIEAFSPSMRGSNTKAKSAHGAYWFVDNPEVAGGYARMAGEDAPVQKLIDESYAAERRGEWDKAHDLMVQAEQLEPTLVDAGGQNIMPLKLRGKFKEIDADGATMSDLDDGQLDKWVREAKKEGYDGLKILNFSDNADYGNYTPATHYAVFDEKNIRSKNATFDPKKADSANLNAMLTDALMAQAASMA